MGRFSFLQSNFINHHEINFLFDCFGIDCSNQWRTRTKSRTLLWIWNLGSYHPFAWKHPAIECDEATCTTCKEAHPGPILATNCHYECGKCALCSAAKAKGLEEEVAKCEANCGDGIFACTRNCLKGQDKCLACAPKCGKY